MPFGPVASGAKDLAEMDPYLSDDECSYTNLDWGVLRRSTVTAPTIRLRTVTGKSTGKPDPFA